MRILGYNTPTHTLLLHYIYDTVSKLRSLKNADSSVSENVLFPLAVFLSILCRLRIPSMSRHILLRILVKQNSRPQK